MSWPDRPLTEAEKYALRAVLDPALEKLRKHMAREDGHDGTYGCKRCAEGK